jgi:hypothetical protein
MVDLPRGHPAFTAMEALFRLEDAFGVSPLRQHMCVRVLKVYNAAWISEQRSAVGGKASQLLFHGASPLELAPLVRSGFPIRDAPGWVGDWDVGVFSRVLPWVMVTNTHTQALAFWKPRRGG